MATTYYKLAIFDERTFCWKDGKRGYDTEEAAKADATKPGKYRLSMVVDGHRADLEPFEVAGTAATAAKARKAPRGQAGPTSLVYGRRYK